MKHLTLLSTLVLFIAGCDADRSRHTLPDTVADHRRAIGHRETNILPVQGGEQVSYFAEAFEEPFMGENVDTSRRVNTVLCEDRRIVLADTLPSGNSYHITISERAFDSAAHRYTYYRDDDGKLTTWIREIDRREFYGSDGEVPWTRDRYVECVYQRPRCGDSSIGDSRSLQSWILLSIHRQQENDRPSRGIRDEGWSWVAAIPWRERRCRGVHSCVEIQGRTLRFAESRASMLSERVERMKTEDAG